MFICVHLWTKVFISVYQRGAVQQQAVCYCIEGHYPVPNDSRLKPLLRICVRNQTGYLSNHELMICTSFSLRLPVMFFSWK